MYDRTTVDRYRICPAIAGIARRLPLSSIAITLHVQYCTAGHCHPAMACMPRLYARPPMHLITDVCKAGIEISKETVLSTDSNIRIDIA